MVDVLDLGSSVCKDVRVRVSLPVLKFMNTNVTLTEDRYLNVVVTVGGTPVSTGSTHFTMAEVFQGLNPEEHKSMWKKGRKRALHNQGRKKFPGQLQTQYIKRLNLDADISFRTKCDVLGYPTKINGQQVWPLSTRTQLISMLVIDQLFDMVGHKIFRSTISIGNEQFPIEKHTSHP